MKIHKTIQRQQLYKQYIEAQGECPHWDYECPEGMEYKCCIEMREAKQALKKNTNQEDRMPYTKEPAT